MPDSRIIFVRIFRDGREVYEAGGVQPYYSRREDAIGYARQRLAGAGTAVVHLLDAGGTIVEKIER
jgi:hypothetical protein